MATIQCEQCGKETRIIPARLGTARFCSNKCRADWRRTNFTGAANPNYRGGPDRRTCPQCGVVFECRKASKVRFCSRTCSKVGQVRYEGKDHPLYKPDSRRRNRRGKHGAWSRAVISRDKATCQHCGAQGVELHAHHIKPFETYPELRWDLDNGLTLCAPCHWKVHSTASIANGVNSGELRPGSAEDNPEPSFGRKPVEGVTTNGRAYRRWTGKCDWCGVFISKQWSDVVGKAHLFCGKRCMGKYAAANRSYRRWRNPDQPNGSNSDTSALPERDDIV